RGRTRGNASIASVALRITAPSHWPWQGLACSPHGRGDRAVCPSLIGGDGMKLSTERILTTHVGSLARPPDLFDMLAARASGQPYDAVAFETRVRQAIADVVRRQAELGIDIIDDG